MKDTVHSVIRFFAFALVSLSLMMNRAQAGGTQATAVAYIVNGFVVGIVMTSGGSGYLTPPAVTITGGGGTGASALANISQGAVTSITVVNAGSGYVSPPTVIIAPPEVPSIDGIQMVPMLTISGVAGSVYQIQYAPQVGAVTNWQVLTNLLLPASPYTFIDTTAAGNPQRFYQLVASPSNGVFSTSLGPMAWIPPGTFFMGSPATEQDRLANEGPQTQVTLTHGFWMVKYLVTQGKYQDLMGVNPSSFKGDTNRPVESLSWYSATNFCWRLTTQEQAAGRLPTGYVYRLPTEAEWEYACRAGTTTRFSYGEDSNYLQFGNYGWYSANSSATTHPVGAKLPNPWGLYDIYGDVYEWCWDWYGTYPGGSVTDPTGPASGSNRTNRGGSWNFGASAMRSASRGYISPDSQVNVIGLRPVLAPALK